MSPALSLTALSPDTTDALSATDVPTEFECPTAPCDASTVDAATADDRTTGAPHDATDACSATDAPHVKAPDPAEHDTTDALGATDVPCETARDSPTRDADNGVDATAVAFAPGLCSLARLFRFLVWRSCGKQNGSATRQPFLTASTTSLRKFNSLTHTRELYRAGILDPGCQ